MEHELAGGKTTKSPCHVGTMNGASDGKGEPAAASLVSLVSMSTRQIGHRLLDDNHWSIHSMWNKCMHGKRLENKTFYFNIELFLLGFNFYCIPNVFCIFKIGKTYGTFFCIVFHFIRRSLNLSLTNIIINILISDKYDKAIIFSNIISHKILPNLAF